VRDAHTPIKIAHACTEGLADDLARDATAVLPGHGGQIPNIESVQRHGLKKSNRFKKLAPLV
jgi:hypothetical protein